MSLSPYYSLTYYRHSEAFNAYVRFLCNFRITDQPFAPSIKRTSCELVHKSTKKKKTFSPILTNKTEVRLVNFNFERIFVCVFFLEIGIHKQWTTAPGNLSISLSCRTMSSSKFDSNNKCKSK